MTYELLPILEKMKEFYNQPISHARFQKYIYLLKGNLKSGLILPIMGYNPMAKSHVLEKIQALINRNAEEIMQETLHSINSTPKNRSQEKIKVVLNIADDAQGKWTDHFTTDYASKFDINALVAQRFCCPYVYTSEEITENILVNRTIDYATRTKHWITHSKPRTLKDFINQEYKVILANNNHRFQINNDKIERAKAFLQKHIKTDNYSIIFNFFYGDAASQTLNFSKYGIEAEDANHYLHSLI